MKGDRRFIPEENYGEVCREFDTAMSNVKLRHPEIDLKYSCDAIYAPMLTDMNNSWVKEVQIVASETAGRSKPCRAQGALMWLMLSMSRIACLLLRIGRGLRAMPMRMMRISEWKTL